MSIERFFPFGKLHDIGPLKRNYASDRIVHMDGGISIFLLLNTERKSKWVLTVSKDIRPPMIIKNMRLGFAPAVFTTFSVDIFSFERVTFCSIVSEWAILRSSGVFGSSIS